LLLQQFVICEKA